jgi:hypothetical protein
MVDVPSELLHTSFHKIMSLESPTTALIHPSKCVNLEANQNNANDITVLWYFSVSIDAGALRINLFHQLPCADIMSFYE